MLNQQENKISYSKNPGQTEEVKLVHSGEDYFLRIRNIISNAQSEIHLQTYIFDTDPTGIEIVNVLKEAASRNVKIYILLDGYGSSSFSKKIINDLKLQGINIRFFSPFLSTNNFCLGRRLHHKIIVADGNIALIGGINIAGKYHGTSTKEPWLDYAVQIENREIAGYLEGLCRNIYTKKKRVKKGRGKRISSFGKGASISILQNDWLKKKNEISGAYIKAIRNAKKEVHIVGSYFLPGRRLTNVLKKASRRGVKIKLILSGVSDILLMKRATCYLYSSLLKYNIELFEWNKSVLHGKAAVADNEWATIGSFNLNHLSSYGSIEMNVEMQSPDFAKTFASHLDNVIAQCEKVTYETIKLKSGIFTKIINWLAYRLVRVVLIIITYIPYKRSRN